jgi:predicted RNase H-like HicB family nuclease
MRYAIVIEKANGNYSAYAPDVPGCIATGVTLEEVKAQMREALEFHLEGLQREGQPLPQPAAVVDYVEAGVPVAR